ncbi:MAG: alpha/beta hydrolase [Cyclobacteriaceae bacterium]|nr:alpha/beta hydrolase [Cyclobacteriaceae bacterium]
MSRYFSILLFLIKVSMLHAQTTWPLYPADIPNSKPTTDTETVEVRDGITIVGKITKPTLTVYRPAKSNGTAVIICPGGAYWINATVHEGSDVAKKFNDWGVTAFVLKYRIPNEATMVNKEIGPLQDAQQAIKTVREKAKEFGIDPARIGIMGFSAGGHLASTAATHFTKSVINNGENTSLRPDFVVLVYPVISFQNAVGHLGSRDQLIGKNPSQQKIDEYSNELHVSAQTPPAFLIHASDDDGVSPENSVLFYQQLIKNKVPAELHLYQKGGHGFGMNNPTTKDEWMERLKNWMLTNRWLN